jgi:RecA-family ATPase
MPERCWDSDAALSAEIEAERERYRETEPPPPEREPLHVINPAKWQGIIVPERRWLVPHWIPFGVATGLYGPPGHGKTLLVQQLMTAAAIGKFWLGCPVTRVKSIAFLCEDDEDELHRRQEAINAYYGCDYRDLDEYIRFVPRLGCDNLLMTFRDGRGLRTPFYDQVIDEARSFGAALAVVDTVADTFGGNQNDMGNARQYVQAVGGIARAIEGAALACAHPSQSGKNNGSGESGSVQWDAAFRSRLYLDAPKFDDGELHDDNARVLTRKKANYAARGETLDIAWKDGVFVSTRIPDGIIGSIERRTCEHIVLDLVEQLASEKQWVSNNSRAGNYAPRVFMRRADRNGFKTADFARAVDTLLAGGVLINEQYGRKGDERYRLARSNGHAP